MRRFFFENPDYRLSHDRYADGWHVAARSGFENRRLARRRKYFSGQSGAACTIVLQQLPQVDEVEVVRKLPGEIDIRILERKPIAWITSEKQIADPFQSDVAFLMDARGVLMKEKKLLPEYLGLPADHGLHERITRIRAKLSNRLKRKRPWNCCV